MTSSLIGPVPGRRWIFRPLYLLIIWGLFALILIINGTYETKRAEDSLYRMLFDAGSAMIDGLEKSVQSVFTSLAAIEAFPEASTFMIPPPINLLQLEESVVDSIFSSAMELDQEMGSIILSEDELKKIGEKKHFSGIAILHDFNPRLSPALEARSAFYQPLIEGKTSYAIDRSEKKETGQINHLGVAIIRKAGEGILVVQAEEGDIQFFRRRVILQGLIEEWQSKGETQYIVLQGEDSTIWADTDPMKIGKKDENLFARRLIKERSILAQSQKKSDVLEVAKVVTLDKNNRGVIRVGLSSNRLNQIIKADKRNIVLFSFLLLIFGGLGIAFIYRIESRHLVKIQEMEEKVHQSEKLSSLANLAAGVAHEIRNPLNAIGMTIQRLQREFAPEAPELQKEFYRFTEVLRGEVKRVNKIIEQFLFFARPAGLDLKTIKVQEILQDLFLLAREGVERQKVFLEEDIEPDLPPLKLDRQKIHEALWNLIHNGIQAMPGGGKLKVSAKFHEGKKVLIQISDTGDGILEENLNKIFDYYFTTKEKGMGLGLSLAHKIIHEHGGSIEVKSAPGKGTTFQVFLPVPKEEG